MTMRTQYEIDPNGSFRIFGIGTIVRVPTGEHGEVVKIGRKKLTVELATMRRPCRSYYSHELVILK